MNENTKQCPNCGRQDEISRAEFAQLVASNREAAMQALGVRKGENAPHPRFRLEPFVDKSGDVPRVGLRRVSG